ncbi:MAG: PDZ domain-containing protein [Myxococcaceae bacterium]|nr:PDZ domain-containing protein [Myxococcaceae bacterium]
MKRGLVIFTVLLVLVGVIAVYLWPREAAVIVAVTRPQAVPLPSRVAQAPPPAVVPAPKASLFGRVLRNGKPVPNATVVVRSDDVKETTTGADGKYAIEVDALTQLYVSARAGQEASDVAGPFMLGSDEQLGVDLSLWPAAHVTGVVVDESRRTPIPKARLTSSAGTVAADAQGRFSMGPLPGRISWLQISADGYFTRLEWLSLTAAREQAGLELGLVPLATVKGVVLENGQPAPQALVWADGASSADRARACPAVRSAADGTFKVECPEGRWTLNATGATGNGAVSRTVWLTAYEKHDNVVLELAPTSQVVGQVTRAGEGVPNALITLVDARTHAAGGSSYADTEGTFRLNGVAVGEWLLHVHTGSGASVHGPFELAPPPETTRWNVQLPENQRLTGRVEPPTQGVVIQVLAGDGLGLPVQTMTDAKGGFVVDPVPRGDLIVEAQGSTGSARTRAQAGADVVLVLEKATLAVEAVDGTGQPLADFTVGMQPSPVGPARRVRVLSPTGQYEADVSPGAWDVWVEGPMGRSSRVPVSLSAGRQEVRVTMPQSNLLTGTVRDVDDGHPLGGAQITLEQIRPLSQGYVSTPSRSVLTQADGSFSLSAPSEAGLWFRAEGYQSRYVPLHEPGFDARRPLDIRLQRGAGDVVRAPYEGVGMVLLDLPQHIKVADVFAGSPAELAGVRADDVILLVDGIAARPPAQKNVIPLIMGRAGTTVVLTVQRGGERLEFALRRGLIRF